MCVECVREETVFFYTLPYRSKPFLKKLEKIIICALHNVHVDNDFVLKMI